MMSCAVMRSQSYQCAVIMMSCAVKHSNALPYDSLLVIILVTNHIRLNMKHLINSLIILSFRLSYH